MPEGISSTKCLTQSEGEASGSRLTLVAIGCGKFWAAPLLSFCDLKKHEPLPLPALASSGCNKRNGHELLNVWPQSVSFNAKRRDSHDLAGSQFFFASNGHHAGRDEAPHCGD